MKQANGEKRVVWLAKERQGRWQGGIPVGTIGDEDDYPELSWEDETAKRYTITKEEDEP